MSARPSYIAVGLKFEAGLSEFVGGLSVGNVKFVKDGDFECRLNGDAGASCKEGKCTGSSGRCDDRLKPGTNDDAEALSDLPGDKE